jgi:hypothetical protein
MPKGVGRERFLDEYHVEQCPRCGAWVTQAWMNRVRSAHAEMHRNLETAMRAAEDFGNAD